MVLVSATQLRHAQGPYWLSNNLDPEYAYLLNALNLTQGAAQEHVDHPGTPLTALGAAVLVIAHLTAGRDDLVSDVLRRPEHYLQLIHSCLLCAYMVALVAVGWFGARFGGSIAFGLLWQLTPLLSPIATAALGRVSPEPMLLLWSLCLSGLGVIWSATRDSHSYDTRLVIGMGVFAGLGVATKLTFAPLAILPFALLPSNALRRRYCGWAVLSVFVALIPAWNRLEYMLKWLGHLTLASGRYATGAWTVIRWRDYPGDLWGLAAAAPFVSSLVGVMIVTCIAARVQGCQFRLLEALALTAILQYLMVAKHPAARYLMPVLGQSGLYLAELWRKSPLLFRHTQQRFVGFAVLLGVFCLAGFRLQQHPASVAAARAAAAEATGTRDTAARTFQHCRQIAYYPSSSPEFALHFGNQWAGRRYSEQLSRLFPDYWEYDVYARVYRDASGAAQPVESVLQHACVIFRGRPFRGEKATLAPDVQLIPVAGGPVETIYRLVKPAD